MSYYFVINTLMFLIKQITCIIQVILCSETEGFTLGWMLDIFKGWPVGDTDSLGIIASLCSVHVQFKTLQNSGTNLCFCSEKDDLESCFLDP